MSDSAKFTTMKVAVILCLVFAYFQAEVLARAIEEVIPLEPEEEECVNELKLNKEEILRLNSQDIAPEDNEDFNKFLGCYYKKMGWLDSEGNMDYGNFRDAMEDAIAGELEDESPAVKMLVRQMMISTVTECETHPPPKGKTPGETAVRVQNCVVKQLNAILTAE